uniref:Secreted peptide n=1 Tax=Arundo donax TaxID=35708 RepID=A0A0A9BAU7_ARUDO
MLFILLLLSLGSTVLDRLVSFDSYHSIITSTYLSVHCFLCFFCACWLQFYQSKMFFVSVIVFVVRVCCPSEYIFHIILHDTEL